MVWVLLTNIEPNGGGVNPLMGLVLQRLLGISMLIFYNLCNGVVRAVVISEDNSR